MEHQNELNLYKLYLHNLEQPQKVIKSNKHCSECETDMVLVEFFYACSICGQIGDTNNEYYTEHATDYIPKRQLYKRRTYIEEKLRLLSCNKRPRSSKYMDALKKIKSEEFTNIDELYNILKTNKLFTMYKQIYNLWFDIKKTKLIKLTNVQIDNLSNEFVKMDIMFRQHPGNRKNMYNYNSMIYFLMKKNKINSCNHILLPYNHNFVYKHIREIWLNRDK